MFKVEPYKKLIACRIKAAYTKNQPPADEKMVALVKKECFKTLAKHTYAVKTEEHQALWDYCFSKAKENLAKSIKKDPSAPGLDAGRTS